MITSNNPDSLRLAQAIQAQVKEGGFDLEIKPVEYAALLDQQDRGDFELLQLGWSGRVDPDANITNFVGTGGSQNVCGYTNPEVDKLLDEGPRRRRTWPSARTLYAQVVDQAAAGRPARSTCTASATSPASRTRSWASRCSPTASSGSASPGSAK